MFKWRQHPFLCIFCLCSKGMCVRMSCWLMGRSQWFGNSALTLECGRCLDGYRHWEEVSLRDGACGGQILESSVRGRHPMGNETPWMLNGPGLPQGAHVGAGHGWQEGCLVQALNLDSTLAPDEIVYIVNQWVLWGSHWLRVWHPPNLCYAPTQNALCCLEACFRRRQESITSVECQTLGLELHSCYLVWASPQPDAVSIILPILRWGN